MLADKYSHWLRCVKANQVPLLDYTCPDCKQELQALRPPEGEEPWDSVIECPHCQGLHFRVAHSQGAVESWSLQA
ncbi:MAG: hypothetical protein P1U47_05200 [Zhongshania sp.]|uniref:hypothetical protein n=1 Tax=Zhongshania sp. TaxID=1971902 RepID=UPI0026144ADF|nr:hypothetical protein [Zhongshania sp.]MDF1691744.1 hypothetical protein [Zhongshania sp.]